MKMILAAGAAKAAEATETVVTATTQGSDPYVHLAAFLVMCTLVIGVVAYRCAKDSS